MWWLLFFPPASFIRLLTPQVERPLVEQMGRQKRLGVVPLAGAVLGAQLRQVRQAAQAEEGEEERQAQEEEPEAETRQEEELQEQSRRAPLAGGRPVLGETVQEVALLVPLVLAPPPPLVHPQDTPVALLLQVLHLHPVPIQREVVLALQERFSLQAALLHPVQVSIRLAVAVQVQVQAQIQLLLQEKDFVQIPQDQESQQKQIADRRHPRGGQGPGRRGHRHFQNSRRHSCRERPRHPPERQPSALALETGSEAVEALLCPRPGDQSEGLRQRLLLQAGSRWHRR